MSVHLGNYEIEGEPLGKGGFGTVYRARDAALARTVALKVLHPHFASDPLFIARFWREARAMAALEHPAILPVYGLIEEGGTYAIAMRYLPGGSLAERLKQGGPLPFEQALPILQDICAGLQEAHLQNRVHRDLKPANILFDRAGRAYLSDFGLMKAVTLNEDDTPTDYGREAIGTPFYVPPEIWKSARLATPASDVYALACILAEMLTARRLFGGEDVLEVINKHHLGQPDFGPADLPAGLPEGIWQAIRQALDPDPARRQAHAAAFFDAVQRPWLEQMEQERLAQARRPLEQELEQQAGRLEDAQAQVQALQAARQAWEQEEQRLNAAIEKLNSKRGGSTPNPPPPAPAFKAWLGRHWKAAAFTALALLVVSAGYFLLPAFHPGAAQPPACAANTPSWTSPIDGMQLMCVPAGNFVMGSWGVPGEPLTANETPPHQVNLSAYWIDRTEVSNAQYRQCAAQGACPAAVPAGAADALPVVNVTWQNAKDYCTWAGRALPTEAQWEKAARGLEQFIYPWGSNSPPTPELLNFNNNNKGPQSVYSYAVWPSPYGVLNLAGNVWEWVNDYYADQYYANSPQNDPTGPASGTGRVERGGGYLSNAGEVRSAHRTYTNPLYTSDDLGFRCAR